MIRPDVRVTVRLEQRGDALRLVYLGATRGASQHVLEMALIESIVDAYRRKRVAGGLRARLGACRAIELGTVARILLAKRAWVG